MGNFIKNGYFLFYPSDFVVLTGGLNGKTILFLVSMLGGCTFGGVNYFVCTEIERKQYAADNNMSLSYVNGMMSKLLKRGIIKKRSSGSYWLNPRLAYCGKTEDRDQCLLVFDGLNNI